MSLKAFHLIFVTLLTSLSFWLRGVGVLGGQHFLGRRLRIAAGLLVIVYAEYFTF